MDMQHVYPQVWPEDSKKDSDGIHYDEILMEIERCYKNNSSTTAIDVVNRLKTRGIMVSTTHIKRLRQKLGFKKTTTKYCHTIRDANKLARLDFCREMLEGGVGFSDCVFTDECTVQIDCSTKFCYVKQGDQYSRMRNRAKHPAKVHIWGGISARGTTRFAILPGNCRIDSNLKQGIRTLDGLKVAIAQYWKTLTPEVCSKYIGGIRKRMERIIEQGGRNIVEELLFAMTPTPTSNKAQGSNPSRKIDMHF
ncbi:hypothetical protein OSTOST_16841 [Ostertagia ostertagi]